MQYGKFIYATNVYIYKTYTYIKGVPDDIYNNLKANV